MNGIVESINSTGVGFVRFALPMLIQSGVLILILLLLDILLRKRVRAVFRYWIWMLVLVKLVLPVSLSSPVSVGTLVGDKLEVAQLNANSNRPRVQPPPPAEAAPPPPSNIVDVSAIRPMMYERSLYQPAPVNAPPAELQQARQDPPLEPPTETIPLTWQAVVFLLWLAVVTAMSLLLLQRVLFVRGLLAQSVPAGNGMLGLLDQCSEQMRIKRKLDLRVSVNAASPAVCGLLRPTILMPYNIAPTLSPHQLRAVLLHELAHIRRGDLWINLAQTLLQIAYFYNPLLWLANAAIRRIREQAVDEAVLVAMGQDAQQYPDTLVNVAKLAFKKPTLSLRLIGVVESKSALSARIRHMLNRPFPRTAKLGLLGLAVIIISGIVLLPMARQSEASGIVVEPAPLDIQLIGVRPDAGDDIYDPNGNKISQSFYTGDEIHWGPTRQQRAFAFSLPADECQIRLHSLQIHPTGTDRFLGPGIAPMLYESGNRLIYIADVTIPRTYSTLRGLRTKSITAVDLNLRYYHGPRGKADIVFEGPFSQDQDHNGNVPSSKLVITREGWFGPNDPVIYFSISGKTHLDGKSILVYDRAGRRHLVQNASGSGSQYKYRISGLFLRSIAYITVGETPHECLFKNVKINYPEQPLRDRPQWIGEYVQKLNIADSIPEQDLRFHDFEGPAEAIEVMDTVRTQWFVAKVHSAIRRASPRIQVSDLDEQSQRKIRTTALAWAKVDHPKIRSIGINLGLWGRWPEFFDLALETLEKHSHPQNMAIHAHKDAQWQAVQSVAGEIGARSWDVGPERIERIKQLILQTNDQHIAESLMRFLYYLYTPACHDICWELARDDRPWIWWPAMKTLYEYDRERFQPFESLPRPIQLRLILLTGADDSGSPRYTLLKSLPGYEDLLNEARTVLSEMPTAQFAEMVSLDGWQNAHEVMLKLLDRKTAVRTYIDLIQTMSNESIQDHWVADYSFCSKCCYIVATLIWDINAWYDLDIGEIGKTEVGDTIPDTIPQLRQLIAETLRWYRADPDIATAAPENDAPDATSPKLIANLPHGGTLELVAVRRTSLPDQPWYTPDGTQRIDPNNETLSKRTWSHGAPTPEQGRGCEFLIHADMPDNKLGPPTVLEWRFYPEPKTRLGFGRSFQSGQHYFGAALACHDSLQSTTVALDISNGPWTTVAKHDGRTTKDLNFDHSGSLHKLTFSAAQNKDGSTIIHATHNIQSMAARIIAIDKYDNPRIIHQNKSESAGETITTTCQFDGITTARVDHYQFQLQPIDVLTFTNVSVKDGHITAPSTSEATLDTARVAQRLASDAALTMGPGRYQQADDLLAKALAIKPDFAEAWVGRAMTAMKLNDPRLARKYYETALELHAQRYKKNPNANDLQQQVFILLQLHRDTEAQHTFDLAIHDFPQDEQLKTMTKEGLDYFADVYAEEGYRLESSEEPDMDSLKGKVVDPEGNPVAGAQVAICTKQIRVVVNDGKLEPSKASDSEKTEIVQTDSQGAFEFETPPPEHFSLIAAHDSGYAVITSEYFMRSQVIRLEPWGRIEGRLAPERAALENKIWLSMLPNTTWLRDRREYRYETLSDSDGNFTFDRVPPGWMEVGYLTSTGRGSASITSRTPVEVKSGQTAKMKLADEGRPVTGRFVPPEGYDKPIDFHDGLRDLSTKHPPEPVPDNYDEMTAPERRKWRDQWYQSDEYRAHKEAIWRNPDRRQYCFRVNNDGSFVINDVIAGTYELRIWLEDRRQGDFKETGGYYSTITVPEIPTGKSTDPLDLGDLTLNMYNTPDIGEPAPLFEAETSTGQTFRLADHRGKYVLLSLWPLPDDIDRDELLDLYNTYAGNDQFIIVALARGTSETQFKRTIEAAPTPWPQIFTPRDSELAQKYNPFGTPYVFLIAPNGKIQAHGLRNTGLEAARKALEEAGIAQAPPAAKSRIEGRVINSEGKPVAGAQVCICTKRSTVLVHNGKLSRSEKSDSADTYSASNTNAQGTFDFDIDPPEQFILFASHDSGLGVVESEAFAQSREIHLNKWARVEGQFAPSHDPAGTIISLIRMRDGSNDEDHYAYSNETETISDGSFALEHVPPGWATIRYQARRHGEAPSTIQDIPIEVQAGQTANIELASKSRSVIGRFVAPQGYNKPVIFPIRHASMSPSSPSIPQPQNYDNMTPIEQVRWREEWFQGDEYKAYARAYRCDPNRRRYQFHIEDDGSFIIHDVIEGEYSMHVQLSEDRKIYIAWARCYDTIVIPAIPEDKYDEPLDLGELTLHVTSLRKVGDLPAPLFEAKTLSGETFKLADQKGKYVLLSFWPVPNDPDREQLRDFYNSYSDKVLVVGMGIGESAGQFKRALQADPTPWPQIFVPEDSQLAEDYDLSGTNYAFLIGPNGNIIFPSNSNYRFRTTGRILEREGVTATKINKVAESSKD